jgi:hypothetical protein
MLPAYLFPEDADYQNWNQIKWQIFSIALAEIMLENLGYRKGMFLSICLILKHLKWPPIILLKYLDGYIKILVKETLNYIILNVTKKYL